MAKPSASLAMSTTAVGGTSAASAWRLKPSTCFTFGTTARGAGTNATYSAPAITQASSGTGPHAFCGAEQIQPCGQLAVPVTPQEDDVRSAATAGRLVEPPSSEAGAGGSGRAEATSRG